MDKKPQKTLTRENILGMQVINGEGMVVGNVKDLSLVVGESDQALIVQGKGEGDTVVRWSEVAAVGDVILMKPTGEAKAGKSQAGSDHCPSCGQEMEKGAAFCGNCGTRTGPS
jgi:sporulation protein YlmC with PRC-barrel domain